MKTWTFDLVADRPTTPEEENAFDRCDAFSGGDIGYATGGGHPTEFHCNIDAETLEGAVSEAMCRIHGAVPDLNLTPSVPDGVFDRMAEQLGLTGDKP